MAYYAALVSVVQLLKEINHPQHSYPNSLLPKKHQIHAALYEKFNLVLELLENYSLKDHKEEYADILEGRIRDAAYRAQNIIESQISNHIPRRNMQKVMEEVDLIVEELRRIKLESRKAHEKDDFQQQKSCFSADRGLVPLVQLLEEMSHHNQYPNSLLDKGQIASLLENFKLLQEAMQKEELAGFLEKRIRDAANWTHDIIKTHISNKKRGDISLNILAKEYQDLKKVGEEVVSILEQIMRIEMEKVSIHGDNLQETNVSASSAGASTQAQKMDVVGGASKVQGRSGTSTTIVLDEDLITAIKGQLCGESSRREVISVVGMGGLGKTTLARYIFDDELIQYRFDYHAWVTASQDYHSRNTLLAIVDSLNMEMKEELRAAEVGVLREQIYKHLKGRRYVIVVDDVWETEVWDDVNRVFPNDNNGSRVIVTTRLLNVAVHADSPRFIHELQFLNEDQSWNLFSQKVFCPTKLEHIGRLIAKNCRGLPLAIVVVAGLLSKVSKTQYDWEEIARDVSSAAIDQNDEHFSKILSLSYNHLPHHLKPCFLYLGGFPKDYDIRASELIWLWIGEGLLQPIVDKSLEEVGEEYLKDLVERNLVLITEKKFCDKIKKCGIHDFIRDLCLQKACSERFFHCLHKKEDFSREPEGDVLRFSINMWSDSLFHIFKKKCVSHVRSILFFPENNDLLDLLSTASGFNLLRVLDTRYDEREIFPEVVAKFLHLRYLALRNSYFSPSMFKLQNLQTLIVGEYSILPSEIWKMPQLRHVKGKSLYFPPIPYGEIRIIDGVPLLGNLQTLQTIHAFTRDTVEMIPNLKKLKVLYLHFEIFGIRESQLNNLVHLRKLEELSIEISGWRGIETPLPENFAFPSTLIKLTLDKCNFPWEDMRAVGSLPNLQVLKLISNSFIGEEWEPAEGEFLKLRSLLMNYLDLRYWRAEDIHFPCLQKLHIRRCHQLLEIPLGIGDIPTLQCIVVEECNSGVDSSALKIQEEQQDLGNDDLHVRVIPAYNPFDFAFSEDSNSTNASDDCSEDGNPTNAGDDCSEDGKSTNASDDCSEDGNPTNASDDCSEDGNSTNEDDYSEDGNFTNASDDCSEDGNSTIASDDWNSAQKFTRCTTYLFDTSNEGSSQGRVINDSNNPLSGDLINLDDDGEDAISITTPSFECTESKKSSNKRRLLTNFNPAEKEDLMGELMESTRVTMGDAADKSLMKQSTSQAPVPVDDTTKQAGLDEALSSFPELSLDAINVVRLS